MEEKLKMMEEYLQSEYPIFINYEDEIDEKTFQRLRELCSNYSSTKFKKCFERTPKDGGKFTISYKCNKCNEIKKVKINKTNLFYLLEKKEIECKECEEKRVKEFKNKQQIERYKQKLYKEQIESEYYSSWLSAEYSLNKNVFNRPWEAKNSVIISLNIIDRKELKKFVDSMPYKMYLSTPYWQLVSLLAKRKAGYKCQLCGDKNNLNVHHRSYENKGTEILNMGDLIVLCQECHRKFHEVI